MDKDDKRLHNLDEIDYKVESHDPDVRGWEVRDASGRRVGEVDNLLVNKERKKVVYLDVDVDDSIIEEGHKPLDEPAEKGVHEFENKEGEDHLIIPIGMANVNKDDKYVSCDNISYNTFAGTKRYRKGEPIDSEYERYVVGRYREDSDWEDRDDDDFYDSRAFQVSEYRQ